MIYADDPKYGIRKDGTGDNAVAFDRLMQEAAQTQQAVTLPSGAYQTSLPIGAFDGARLIGEHRAMTKVVLHPSAAAAGKLFDSGGHDDVTVEGICFDGRFPQGEQQRADGSALVSLVGGNNVVMRDCTVQNVFYVGVEIAYGVDVVVRDCLFAYTGRREATPEGGPALWIGGTRERPTQQVLVDGCVFEDLEWSAIYSVPQFGIASDVTINRCVIRRVKESAVFGYGFPRFAVVDCEIEDVRVKFIAASGIETGGTCTLRGNKIRRTQAQCISLQDCIDAIVVGNEVSDGSGYAITHTCIARDPETLSLIGPPRNSQIRGNMFDGGPAARIGMFGQLGAEKASSFIVADNTGLASDGGLDIDPTFQGEQFFVARNLTTRIPKLPQTG